MNTEELIDRLLDGTLTDTELRQLERFMISDDAVSNQVREMLHLEEAMNRSAGGHYAASEAYRQDVADRVKEKMRAESGALVGTSRIGSMMVGIGSFMRGKAAIGVGILLATALIVPLEFGTENEDGARSLQPMSNIVEDENGMLPPVGGMLAEMDADRSDMNPVNDQAEEISSTVPESEAADQVPADGITAQANAIPTPVESVSHMSESVKPGSDEAQYINEQFRGQASAKSSKRREHLEEATRLHEKMREMQVSGDVVNAVQVRKQLGILYRGIGMHDESARYLDQVVSIARQEGIRDLEATALGELGLLDRELGRIESARSRLEACVEIKRVEGSLDLKRWENELHALPQ